MGYNEKMGGGNFFFYQMFLSAHLFFFFISLQIYRLIDILIELLSNKYTLIFSYLELLFLFAVSSGSVTVNADSSVQLLAEEAVPLDQLDVAVSINFALLPIGIIECKVL